MNQNTPHLLFIAISHIVCSAFFLLIHCTKTSPSHGLHKIKCHQRPLQITISHTTFRINTLNLLQTTDSYMQFNLWVHGTVRFYMGKMQLIRFAVTTWSLLVYLWTPSLCYAIVHQSSTAVNSGHCFCSVCTKRVAWLLRVKQVINFITRNCKHRRAAAKPAACKKSLSVLNSACNSRPCSGLLCLQTLCQSIAISIKFSYFCVHPPLPIQVKFRKTVDQLTCQIATSVNEWQVT